jgi:hypothetical protein
MKTYFIVSLGLQAPFPHFPTLAAARSELRTLKAWDVAEVKRRYGKAGVITCDDSYEIRIGGKQGANTWSARSIVAA